MSYNSFKNGHVLKIEGFIICSNYRECELKEDCAHSKIHQYHGYGENSCEYDYCAKVEGRFTCINVPITKITITLATGDKIKIKNPDKDLEKKYEVTDGLN